MKGSTAGFHHDAIFSRNFVRTGMLAELLYGMGEYVAGNGILEGWPAQRGARRISAAPRCTGPEKVPVKLPCGLFACCTRAGIQGRSGAGAESILALVRASLKVGITANSHKVIRNRLENVVDLREAGLP